MTRHTADYSGFHNKIKPNCKGYTTIHTRMRKYGVSEEVAMKMVDLKRKSPQVKFYVKYNGKRTPLKMAIEQFLDDNKIFVGLRSGYTYCCHNRKQFGSVQKVFNFWTNRKLDLFGKVAK